MNLKRLRNEVDLIDRELLLLLRRRFLVVQKIALLKKELNLSVTDKTREMQIKKRVQELGRDLSLEPEFLVKIFRLIIIEAKRLQKEI